MRSSWRPSHLRRVRHRLRRRPHQRKGIDRWLEAEPYDCHLDLSRYKRCPAFSRLPVREYIGPLAPSMMLTEAASQGGSLARFRALPAGSARNGATVFHAGLEKIASRSAIFCRHVGISDLDLLATLLAHGGLADFCIRWKRRKEHNAGGSKHSGSLQETGHGILHV
jgi:hypothetical protein